MAKCRLLIVDDDIDDIILYNEVFRGKDYKIDIKCFSNPEGVYPYLTDAKKEELPHLIICDLNMHKVNGFELLERLQSTPKLKDIPVIICTSSNHPNDIRKCKELGATDYIVKPMRLHEYFRIVDDIVTRFLNNNCEL